MGIWLSGRHTSRLAERALLRDAASTIEIEFPPSARFPESNKGARPGKRIPARRSTEHADNPSAKSRQPGAELLQLYDLTGVSWMLLGITHAHQITRSKSKIG